MTPRTAKRRVRWALTQECLYIDGVYEGCVRQSGLYFTWHRNNLTTTEKTRAAARRALLRAVRGTK